MRVKVVNVNIKSGTMNVVFVEISHKFSAAFGIYKFRFGFGLDLCWLCSGLDTSLNYVK